MNTCSACQQPKPAEAFRPGPSGNLRSMCRDCEKARKRTQYHENAEVREKARAYARAYHAANYETIRPKRQAWIDANKERLLVYGRTYNATHKEKRNAQDTERRRNKPQGYWKSWPSKQQPKPISEERKQKVAAYHKEWSQKNKDKILDRARNRRARKQATKGSAFERIQRKDIIARDGLMCYLCAIALTTDQVTLDHVVPLAKGGHHTASNIRIACRSCNSSKGARTHDEYLLWKATHRH